MSFLISSYVGNGTLTSNPAFQTTPGFPLPLLGLNQTNRLRFWMVDQKSGRVIDYVQLDGMNAQRNLSGELMNSADTTDRGGHGGVWDTNRWTGRITDPLKGDIFEIEASEQGLAFNNPGYQAITASDWANMTFPPPNFSSVNVAVSTVQRIHESIDLGYQHVDASSVYADPDGFP